MTWLAIAFFAAWLAMIGWCVILVVRANRYWSERERYNWWLEGRCLRCGYDVRSNIARCPECGARLPPMPENN